MDYVLSEDIYSITSVTLFHVLCLHAGAVDAREFSPEITGGNAQERYLYQCSIYVRQFTTD